MTADPQDTSEPTQRSTRRSGKYHRARLRSVLFTVGPNRLSGGRVVRRHLRSDITINEQELHARSWPEAWSGLRIGHVSDFHLGELLPISRALEIVARLAQQQPDMVVCTGDVVDLHHGDEDQLFAAMAAINAPFGTYLVLGNHDHLDCGDTVARTAERNGVTVLRDETIRLVHNGSALNIAGIDWANKPAAFRRSMERACDDDTHLLLSHNPKAFRFAARMGIPLTLSGHTHGGQVAMKSRPGVNLSISHRYSAGVYERNNSLLFVTTGVGAWFPLRVNCPAEIALLTMRAHT